MKYPDASITFLVKSKFAALLMLNPHLTEVLTYDDSAGKGELRRIIKDIRKNDFDWFIDLHKSLRTRYIRTLLRFPRVTSYNKQIFSRTLLVKFGINRFKTIKPVYLRYFEAVERRGIAYDQLGTEVYYGSGDKQFVENLLEADGYPPSHKLIVICPGASYKNKQWLPDRFAKIADDLLDNSQNYVVMLGGKSDFELCEGIIAMMKNKTVNYAGRLSLLQSAALLHKSSLTITNDSGMMHLAQAQKSPVVGIFGATSRELGFYPLPEKSKTVEKPVSCRPCTHKGLNHCPKKHFNCMSLITTDDVLDAVRNLTSEIFPH
jgi:heptosyltransferase-2